MSNLLEAPGLARTFGDWLREQRKLARLTQDELAERAGCSKAYISTLERDMPHAATGSPPRPSVAMAQALAHALDVPVDVLLAALVAPDGAQPVDPSKPNLRQLALDAAREALREAGIAERPGELEQLEDEMLRRGLGALRAMPPEKRSEWVRMMELARKVEEEEGERLE